MIQRTMYVLAVQDLNVSGTFYRDGCRIMAGHCPDALPSTELGDHSYFAYFVVDDIEVLLNDRRSVTIDKQQNDGPRYSITRTIDSEKPDAGDRLLMTINGEEVYSDRLV